MKWFIAGPIGCFDCESTGISVAEDRIVTATVGLLQPGTPWNVDVKSYLIDPGVDISPEATAVHGITNEYAKEHGEEPGIALDLIAHDLARIFLAHIPVVVMNGVFDFTLADREFRRYNLPTLEERLGRLIGPVVDVLVLDKWLDPYRKGGRKLTDLCAQYGVKIDGAHDSAFDALAAARVAYRMALLSQDFQAASAAYVYKRRNPLEIVERLATLGAMSMIDLHLAQVRWRREQCDSLRAHFDRNGTAHDGVPGDWPCIPFLTATNEAVLLHGL